MSDNLVALLKSSNIFSSLDESSLQQLTPFFEETKLKPDEVLFYQGQPSDFLYILVSGKLVSLLTTAKAKDKFIGFVNNGETVGELGVITNQARSLTVKAVEPCTLLKISADNFIQILSRFPSIIFETMQPIFSRSQKVINLISGDHKRKHIAIVAGDKFKELDELFANLINCFNSIKSITYLCDYNNENETDSLTQLIKDDKKTYIYLIKDINSKLATIYLKKIEAMYVVIDNRSPPSLDNNLTNKIKNNFAHFKNKIYLVLLHNMDSDFPTKTDKWLELNLFSFCYHIRTKKSADLHRLVRYILDKPIGLVLGGGGAKGWFMIGVIKALNNLNIPIDYIGGTSTGAAVAACYTTTTHFDNLYKKFQRLFQAGTRSIKWKNLTWPLISLFSSKDHTDTVIDVFKDIHIENLWLPYFAITSELANKTEVVHQKGLLWETIRASTALPGVLPPMLLEGKVHYDGGLTNNLPTDVMRSLIGEEGIIIAVDLSGGAADEKNYNFPPIITLKKSLLSKLGIAYKDYHFPPFIDTFLQALLLNSAAKSKQNMLLANILISSDFSQYSLVRATQEEIDTLITNGYTETIKKMTAWKKSLAGDDIHIFKK